MSNPTRRLKCCLNYFTIYIILFLPKLYRVCLLLFEVACYWLWFTTRIINCRNCGVYFVDVEVDSICGKSWLNITITLRLLPRPPRGLRGIVFTLSVCLCVCLSVCVCVCPANILVFYFSAIRRDIDLNTYRVVLNSLTNIDLHRLKVKVTGTVHCILKVQSYHKNWAIENFQYFSMKQ